MNGISAYFNKAKTYSTMRFIGEMTVLTYFFKIIGGTLYASIFLAITDRDITQELPTYSNTLFFFIFAVGIVPFAETLIGQAVPVWVVSLFTRKRWLQIWVPALFFTLLHPLAVYGSILPVGAILTWTYIIKNGHSWWQGFLVTSLLHGVHNAVAFLFLLL